MSLLKNIIFDLHGVLFEYSSLSAMYFDENYKKIQPIDYGLDILKSCYLNGIEYDYKFYVCTNWDDSMLGYIKDNFQDIMQFFHGIVNSSEAKSKKPDHKIFFYLIDKYNLDPKECLLIDDQEKNIDVAKELGMTAIHAKDFNYINNELQRLNVFSKLL